MSTNDDDEFFRDFNSPKRDESAKGGAKPIMGGLWISAPSANSIEQMCRSDFHAEPATAIEIEWRGENDGGEVSHEAPAVRAVEPPTELEKIRSAIVDWHMSRIALARSLGPSLTEKQFADACKREGL